jgi:hypothetical protein
VNLHEFILGQQGSPERWAHDIRLAIRVIDKEGLSPSLNTEFRSALRQMAQALENYDAEFFRKLATGLETLHANLPPRQLKRQVFLLIAYFHLFGQHVGKLPLRKETFELADDLQAVTNLQGGRLPALPLPKFDAVMKEKIASIKKDFRKRNTYRDCKNLGLKFARAKPGPKTKSKLRDKN